ncbi:MAG: PKD domain-containing protein [Bacteroidota bacterium]
MNTLFTLSRAILGFIVILSFPISLSGQTLTEGQETGDYDPIIPANLAFPLDVSLIGFPSASPNGAFTFETASICNDIFSFTDLSTNDPQVWTWDFGDGGIDSVQHPKHIYTVSGIYTVTLVVSNTLGSDTATQSVIVDLLRGPTVIDQEVCKDRSAIISLLGSNTYTWYDGQGVEIDTGALFISGPLPNDTTLYVKQTLPGAIDFVGPKDSAIGGGTYLDVLVPINFITQDRLTIQSVWVDAAYAGPRTISLWRGFRVDSVPPIASVTVVATQGTQRIDLNLDVPGPGEYSIGGENLDFFFNFEGASYPYEIEDLLTILAPTLAPANFYFYFYDWEIEGPRCEGDLVPIDIKTIEPQFSFIKDTTTRTVAFTDLTTNATSWEWDFGDGSSSTLQNPTHTYTNAGVYPVSLRVNKSCNTQEMVSLPVLSSLDTYNQQAGISILPNPAKNQVQIQMAQAWQEDVSLTLYTIEGKAIQHKILLAGATHQSFDLRGVSAGVYLIQVDGVNMRQSLRLMIQP